MESGRTHNEDDPNWVDDVLSRAIEESYENSPKFKPTEEDQATSTNVDSSKGQNTGDVKTVNISPYPDESPEFEPILNANAGSEKKSNKSALEWLAVIVGALLVAFLIKTFLMQAYYIPSSSMTPTLQIGDRVLVNKLSYEFGDISRGDMIVFQKPNSGAGTKTDLIKRVIALEGEWIEIFDGQIFIKEAGATERKLLEEPYLADGVTTTGFVDFSKCEQSTETTCLIPDKHVFVLGDNRSGSRDSRYFGPVGEESVVGRAFIRIWPLGSLKLL
ncbi:MAG: signal peptidase I [Actinomycetota bacterium]|nr:signal peptidase I [Actinomycetota bacterium]